MNSIAQIKIFNKKVGAVAYDSTKGSALFEFEDSFLKTGLDLSPIKMPIKNAKGKIFSFTELSRSNTFKGMPGLLADVLPDKYGNTLINNWLAKNGRPTGSLDPVETLCFIGKRGMGALEFNPVNPPTTNNSTKVEIGSMVQIAQDILSERKSFTTNLSAEEEKAMADILKIGTSAGGARAKAIIAYNPLTKEVKSGQTDAPAGFNHWLIKFDGVDDEQFGGSNGYGRVEMAYYKMAIDCGIDMMESRLFEENERAHFMTRRFDRPTENTKLHVQTFCAMQHYDFNEVGLYSYEQLFETMRILNLPYPQHEQLYRRMLLNVMGRNCDDHTKNFAFVMDETGTWKLSPAYDVCHAYRPASPWVSQQSLSVNGKRNNITKDDLLAVAKLLSIKKAAKIIAQVSEVVSHWEDYADEQKVPEKLRDGIRGTLVVG
jgi:serine/threonine-protein kinase HipA